MHVRRPAMHVRRPAMHGWWRARTHACAPSSHAWLVTRASMPRTARGGLTLMHVRRPAMHGWRRARASHAWLEVGSH